jgi:cytochrome P450
METVSHDWDRHAGEPGGGTVEHARRAWGAYDRDDPYPLFAAMRAQGSVHAVTLADGHDAYAVLGYEEARQALNDPRFSKDMHAALAADGSIVAEGLPGPAFARHMLNVDPPDHTRLRRLVAAAFSARRVEDLRPRVQGIVDSLLDDIAAGQPDNVVDLVESFAFPLPFTVICELLGVPPQDRAVLGRNLTELLAPAVTPAEHARARAASDVVVEMLHAMIETKQRAAADDLVSALVTARDGDERLDDQELASTIFQLIVAGHETTTNLIGNGVVALLGHPHEFVRVGEDPDRIVAVVEEVLRHDGPVHHATFRYALEPVELGGVTIPARSQVLIGLAAANRDEGCYADAEGFDVERGGARHLGFGHGIHHCLGAGLARLEGRLALRSLCVRFPYLRLAVPRSELRWGRGDGLVLRGLSALPVEPGPAVDAPPRRPGASSS